MWNTSTIYKYIYLLVGLMLVTHLYAQQDNVLHDLHNDIDFTMDDHDEESHVYEPLLYESAINEKRPLLINLADRQTLLKSGIFTIEEVEAIINYREEYGAFVEVGEMKLAGIDQRKLVRYKPVLSLQSVESKLPDQHQLLTRARWRSMDQNQGFEGSPIAYFNRYRFSRSTKYTLGTTLKHDAGEPYTAPLKVDFVSAYIHIHKTKIVDEIILGDYALMFGQGLSIWQGFAMRKSSASTSIQRAGIMLRPNQSGMETNFMRGMAVRKTWQSNTMLLFASHRPIHARIKEENGERFFTSLPRSGLHRTTSEQSTRNRLNSSIIGAKYSYDKRFLNLGASYTLMMFDATAAYEQHYRASFDKTNQFHIRQIDLSYRRNNVSVFGEAVMSNHKKAMIAGLHYVLTPSLTYALVYRNYEPGYFTYYSYAFGERSDHQNEKGIYTGLRYAINGDWHMSVYADLFESPWIAYRRNTGGSGTDYFIELAYDKPANYLFYVRWRKRTMSINDVGSEQHIRNQIDQSTDRFRIHFQKEISYKLRYSSRIEWSEVNATDTQTGYLMFHELKCTVVPRKLKTSIRAVYYNTQTFRSAIYGFETNAPYVFALQAYHGRGHDYIGLVSYTLTTHSKMWLRFVQRNNYQDEKRYECMLQYAYNF